MLSFETDPESHITEYTSVYEDKDIVGRGGGRRKATWKRESKTPWREAGPPNHHDDKVDSDKLVVNKELSLGTGSWREAKRGRIETTGHEPSYALLTMGGSW
jgi:hypothetical protein